LIDTILACAAVTLLPVSPVSASNGPLRFTGEHQRGSVLAFAPKAGTKVEKSFLARHALVVQTMKLEGGTGSEVSQQGLEVTSEITLEVTDTYREVKDGRPTELRRLFRAVGGSVDQVFGVGGEERRGETWVADTPLKEASVVFLWIPGEQNFGRHYDEKENLEEYLGPMREDLDLRGLLPAADAAVAPGSQWAIDLSSLQDVFAAGGDLPRVFVKCGMGFLAKPIAAGVAGPLSHVFGDSLQGEASATWKETREEDGVKLAVIAIRARVETRRDQTEYARSTQRTEELLDEISIVKATIDWKFDGEGTLLWNLDAGRFESLTLAGREEVTRDVAYGSGEEPKSRQLLSLAGALQVSAKAKGK
jgi:hypothetical protein